MRRLTAPLVVLLLAAIAAMLAIGMATEDRTPAKSRTTSTTTVTVRSAAVERAEQIARNAAVLTGVPLPANSRFHSQHDTPVPQDGSNMTSHVRFAHPGGNKAVLDHFRAALPPAGWVLVGELNMVGRSALKFQKGDAWLEVSAADIDVDGKKTPGFTLTVNAKDAKALAAQ